jgi:hypothetical protein
VDRPHPLRHLEQVLGEGPFALVILFVSPDADLDALALRLPGRFGGAPVIGCSTAGEISGAGYAEGEIVAVALPAAHFAADVLLIPDLSVLQREALIGQLIRSRQGLAQARPDWEGEFTFLMVDGLSVREDELAGDGTRFRATYVLHDGHALQNAAVLALIRTDCRVKVFSLDHLTPTGARMVVTGADPARRIVHTINAEPAAQEYARILGKDPAQLTPFTFAAHPVVVRIGGKHHVRAIRTVGEGGDLIFFSAIDEGVVLALADPQDMVAHLAGQMALLAAKGPPVAILACDCILRRMEAQEKQKTGAVSAILRDYGVVGFSTYGEQLNAMHVNQTMTGVAIYPPDSAP